MSTKKRNIANSYFRTLKIGHMTAKQISEISGVRQASISAFKNGGDIYSSILQKLIDALPDELYRQYLTYLAESENILEPNNDSNFKMADQLADLALKLRRSRLEEIETN